jgi:membrane protein implicated in regulation of membrane protease activity
MLAIGLAAGALAAHSGAAITVQMVTAAVIGGGAVAGWHLKHGRDPARPAASANRDVNLDVGEIVHVDAWKPDGTATIKYRGANWTVVPEDEAVPAPGAHRVRQVVGNRLVVEKI